jgi:hypothetical protein
MKQSLTLKTTKLILPILIGIFVVSGTLISLPLLKNNYANGEIGYELSDGNAVVAVSSLAKTNFVLPLIPLSFDNSQISAVRPILSIQKYISVFSKDIFRHILFARAP